MTELQAINTILTVSGELPVTDLTHPNAQLVKPTLDFAILELPFDETDFPMVFDSLPPLVQTFVLTRATRKYQLSVVGAADYVTYTEADELLAKRNVIAADIIPNIYLKQVKENLQAKFEVISPSDMESDPFFQFVKLNAVFLFQTAWLTKDFYIINEEALTSAEEDLRVTIIAQKLLPDNAVNKEVEEFLDVYNLVYTDVTADIIEHCKLTLAYRYQPSIIRTPERYPIKAQDVDNSMSNILTKLIVPKKLLVELEEQLREELRISDDIPLTKEAVHYIKVKAAERWQYSVIRYASKMPFSEVDVAKARAKALNSMQSANLLDDVSVKRVVDRSTTSSVTTAGGVA